MLGVFPVVSPGTPAAPSGSLSIIDLGDSGEITATGNTVMDFTSVQAGDLIVLSLSKCRGTSAGGVASVTVDADPATLRIGSDDGTARTKGYIYEVAADAAMAGNAAVTIVVTLSAAGNGTTYFTAYAIRGTVGTNNTAATRGTSATANIRADLTVATDGLIILAGSQADAAPGVTMTPTSPLTTDLFVLDTSAEGHLTAHGTAATTGVLSVGYDQTNGNAQQYGMAAAFYGA